jgi:hypothetical protein
MNNPTLEAGIPVLTEVIPAPQPASLPEPDETSAPVVAEPAVDHVAMQKAHADSEQDNEKWDRMEREIRERVLHQMLERVDFVLEQRVRDSLADVLQIAVEKLASEIKGGLHHSIKDLVTRAVSQEITRLQSTKK